jgi:hypothetical protein
MRTTRWKAVLATLPLVFASVLGWVVATPAPAKALCQPEPIIYFIYDLVTGIVYADETPAANTCNGDNIYAGRISDDLLDGFCAYVLFSDDNLPRTLQQSDCSSDLVGNSFQFFDQGGPGGFPDSIASEFISLTANCSAACFSRLTTGY